MNTQEFLARVLPPTGDGGTYYGLWMANDKAPHERRYGDINDLVALAQQHPQHNVYFATGLYGTTREAAQTKLKKALYLDLDCGPGKSYLTKSEAVEALVSFVKRARFLAPSILVDSGNGIHAYWTFTTPVVRVDWQTMADTLKTLTKLHTLRCDQAPTADAARVMRIPGSFNVKVPATPRPVRVVSDARDYTPEEVRAALGTAATPALRLAAKDGQAVVDNEDLTGGMMDKRPRFAERVIRECEIFKHSLLTQGHSDPEPLWMGLLSVLAHCEDGKERIHDVSRGHPTYNSNETEAKFALRLKAREAGIGPHLCETFNEHSTLCMQCRWKGRIKTPLQLGIDFKEEMPFGYTNVNGKTMKLSEGKNDKGEPIQTWTPVFNYALEDFKLSYEPEVGTTIQFSTKIGDDYVHVTIPASAIHDKRALAGACSKYAMLLYEGQIKEFRDLMVAWSQRMQEARQMNVTAGHMGWVENAGVRGFSVGNKIYWPDGSSTPATLDDQMLAKQYTPLGAASHWLELSHEITKQDHPALNALIATAFAAPLFHLVGQDGFFLSFSSRSSGSGKTTGLRMAQAVWGDPARGVNVLDDTTNSVVKKLGFLHSLPAYWDEVRIKGNPAQFVSLLFQLTQGKERSRLSSQSKLQIPGVWETMLVVATNDKIIDHVKQESKATDAGRARIFEVDVASLARIDLALADRVARLKSNYGWAGVEYARHLVQNATEIGRALSIVIDSFSVAFRAKPAERFWVTGCAAILVGAQISNKLKLTSIDLNTLGVWLKHQFLLQRASLDADYRTLDVVAKTLVSNFTNEYRDQFIVCETLPVRGTGSIGRVYTQPQRGRIVGMIATKDRKVRVDHDFFADWLYKQKETPSQIIRALVDFNLGTVGYGRLIVGTTTASGKVKAIDIVLSPEVMNDLAPDVFDEE